LVHGDAHEAATVAAVRALRPGGFGLVVLDAEPEPAGKVALLRRWAEMVAPGGYLVVEDVESPECRDADGAVEDGIDRFLLENPGFGVALEAARHPLIKGRGAVLRRLE
jgi:cephalosporin hydroxylase